MNDDHCCSITNTPTQSVVTDNLQRTDEVRGVFVAARRRLNDK